MARKEDIKKFFQDVDAASEMRGLYSGQSIGDGDMTALEHELEAICGRFFDMRRDENLDVTTLRSDRTQLRNAARKLYSGRAMAYTVMDASKRKPVYSERAGRNILIPIEVHPVMTYLDISWEEKDDYFQARKKQVLERTGEGTRGAKNEILITSVEGIKRTTLDLLNWKKGDSREKFYALTLGLAAATGRRVFEIQAAAMGLPGHEIKGITAREWKKYEGSAVHYIPRRTLSFSGQMKTGQSKNPTRAYPIYGLVANREVLGALKKLAEIIRKRQAPPVFYSDMTGLDEQEINKRINSSTSGDLGEFAKEKGRIFDHLERNGKALNPALFAAKMTRNVYGHVLYAELKIDIDFPDFARPLYGHTGTDVTAEYKGFRVKGIRYNF
jgi:hypothetical protein